MPRDKMTIKFTQMIYGRKTYPVNASAIDMEQFSTYMSSEVNYHTCQRWGGLLGAALLTGATSTYLDTQENSALAKTVAASESEEAQVILNASNGFASNAQKQTKAAATTVTNELAGIAREQFSSPPTIIKHGGFIGIFFEKEVDDDTLPVLFK